jgi:hypothetical protein
MTTRWRAVEHREISMFNPRKILTLALVGIFATSLAGSAMAESTWDKNHPRRDEVNDRLHNQNRRIHQEVREGEMSKQQAARLHRQDHRIRREERLMARNNGGHITKAEQRTLNQQENGVSKKIGE